jgi:hypothetical protein
MGTGEPRSVKFDIGFGTILDHLTPSWQIAEVRPKETAQVGQDPGDARDPSMPMNALLHDNPDLCLPLSEIPGVIIRLSSVSQGSA